ncbi:MAG: flagellar hook-associated protein FlgK [Bryobacteraceae bacterium]|nr:flagellar hook-associated protein FlgK [Bryobacteraceae bacterium]MDW8380237.1 flagellar hook-associated protein FlgK [Bryobacterales bacterium]
MSLFGALMSTAGALRAYEQSLQVIQNNVTNADSPGFVRQRLYFTPKKLDLQQGLPGGVAIGDLISSRDAYAERNVWRQAHLFGRSAQQAADLEQIEPSFKIAAGAGLAGAMNLFFNAVSSWSVNPNDPVARQVVLDRASATARAFQENAIALGEARYSIDRQVRDTVSRINQIALRLQQLNVELRSDARKRLDPSIDAQAYATLEELAQYVDFTVLKAEDGSFSVLLGGQTPLVLGDKARFVEADFSTPETAILNDSGQDITWQLAGGSLKGLLETKRELLPAYEGELNRLALSFAENVNAILASGLDQSGSSPTLDLFTFDPLRPAATLKTNLLQPQDLAAASPTAPGGNANALRLAALATANTISDLSFTEFYGQLAARVGKDLAYFREAKTLQQQLLNQARTLREQQSAVSLDEEAARLIEAQRAYQANAQLFRVLNELTDTLIGLLR